MAKEQYRLRRQRNALGSFHRNSMQTADISAEPSSSAKTDNEATLAALQNRLVVAENIARRTQERVDEFRKRAENAEAALKVKTAEADRLESAFQEAKKVVENAKSQVERVNGEMDNLRKRVKKEKEELQKFASEDILRKLFPIVDNFNVAVSSHSQGADAENLVKGIVMIHRELLGILGQVGFGEIDALGKQFDPHVHEGANTVADETQEDGVVLQIVRPGYRLNDKVLRPAMVVVNKLPQETVKREVTPVTESKQEPEVSSASDRNEEARPENPVFNPLDHARQMLDSHFDKDD